VQRIAQGGDFVVSNIKKVAACLGNGGAFSTVRKTSNRQLYFCIQLFRLLPGESGRGTIGNKKKQKTSAPRSVLLSGIVPCGAGFAPPIVLPFAADFRRQGIGPDKNRHLVQHSEKRAEILAEDI
jgi:hypothetical protein